MKDNQIIVLCGFSSVGKDSIAEILNKEYGYNYTISTTTRPMRNYESQRNPYIFTTNKEFEKLIKENKLIEYRSYNTLVNNCPATWYYGIEKKELLEDRAYVTVVDILGMRELKKQYPNRVKTFFIQVDDNIRKQRCIQRGNFDETEWNRRLQDDKQKFSPEVINKEFDFIISNIDLNKTVKEIIDKVGYR